MIKLVANQLRCLVPGAQHHVINLESMGNDGEEGKIESGLDRWRLGMVLWRFRVEEQRPLINGVEYLVPAKSMAKRRRDVRPLR
jgi:hypothetical protein